MPRTSCLMPLKKGGDVPAMQIARESERVTVPQPAPRIGIEAMAGRWVKTNDKPQWISRVDVTVDGDDLLVRIHGGGESPSPAEWGTVRTQTLYATGPANSDAIAGGFLCFYDFPEARVEVQANLNLGLLVVATYVTFREAGPLSDRFTREFFRIAEEAA